MLAAGRAAGWCLLLGASLTSLHAQVDSDPNDMVGTIEWNNSAGPVRDFLLQSLNHPPAAIHPGGFGVFNMTATPTIPGFSVNSGNVYGTGDGASTPYGLRVQGVDASVPPVPGVVYRVQVTASTPDGATYVFAPQN